MDEKILIQKINNLKKEKDAVILVHNYQRPEIYKVADFIGDSLELSRKAAETNAKIIVFCGVDFMAESAKILNPEKKVLLPALEAKCPMAAMVTAEELLKERKKYKDVAVVSYINTTADVKAVSDICCTSSNAVKVVNSLKEKNIIFVPDRNLADYVARFTSKKIIPWQGYCYVHARFLAEQIREAKKQHPAAVVIAHPECPADVIDEADSVCSTSGMIELAKSSDSKEFLICTEAGMVERLKIEVPNKTFYTLGTICLQQKKNNLQKVYDCLNNETNEVDVPAKIRKNAKKALDRMLRVK
ncbi:MAG: quinolinate synthase NadA [Candidatus Woesearchaeota archaeon]|nr:quinolinate synthase NadA [Candidatus Woesearchaeota archaeon]